MSKSVLTKDEFAEAVLDLLPKKLRKQAQEAIEQTADWELGFDDFDEVQDSQPSDYFLLTDDQPEDYPDGFWYHAVLHFPTVRIIDGQPYIGYEGYYDCGDFCDDGSRFYSLSEASKFGKKFKDILAHLEREFLDFTAEGQKEYQQWSTATGRNPYPF